MRRSRFSHIRLVLLAAILLVCGSTNAQTNSGKLIFADDSGRLQLVNADGTGQTILTTGNTVRDNNPQYSPDGSKIAFDRASSGGPDIFVMNADGTNPHAVVSGGPLPAPYTNVNSDPTWSPDGTRLAFVSNRDGQRKLEIWVVNVD